MAFLIPFLLLTSFQQDGPARFEKLIAQTRAFSVSIQTTVAGSTAHADSVLTVGGPSKARFDVKLPGQQFHLVKSGHEVLEISDSDRMFQVHETAGGIGAIEPQVAPFALQVLPAPLLLKNLKLELPKGIAFKRASAVNGVETYRAKWGDSKASGEVDATIDAAGHLRSYHHRFTSSMGSKDMKWTFTNFLPLKSVPATKFQIIPPIGYTSALFELPARVVSTDDSLSWGKWAGVAPQANPLDRYARGKLIIVFNPESRLDLDFVAAAEAKIINIPRLFVSLGNDNRGSASYWSPPAAVKTFLQSAGTPMMLKIGKANQIENVWVGFDQDNFAATVKEIEDAFKVKNGN